MTDDDRDVANLTDFFMRASHAQLVHVTRCLAYEVSVRGLPGDVALFDVARALRRAGSAPRAEPLARPA